MTCGSAPSAANGRPNVNKFNLTTRTGTEFVLTGTFQTDDHDNAALHQLADGRILAGYSKHNDSYGNRYRITATPGGIAAWTPEVIIPSGGLAGYTTFHYLSVTNKLYWHFRRGLNRQYAISTADYSTWDAEREWVSNGGERPYVKAINNGVNRIDFVFTNGHPAGTINSLWHGYMIVGAGGSETFYKSDGTLIGAGPLTPANATRIWDGATAAGESWSWQISYDAAGRPVVLFAVFPTTTDHRYMHGRWDGSAWQVNEITNGGPYLYAAEPNYSGGLCFDGNNTNIVYASRNTGVTWEIQEWRTANDGVTWAKHRDITSGSASGYVNGRPFSPKGHDGRACCVWWAGVYDTFTDYNTAVMAIGAY
jgi:hypothetical protein